MWLESTVGLGSVFYFTAAFGPAERPEVTGREKIGGRPENALIFLIAEDNAVNRRLAVRQLEKLGHTVVAVGDGKQAVEISSERAFDVILMDVHMPEMDGIDATRQIRRRELVTGQHLPIIALTAGAMKQDRDACLDAGMDAYVSKPINPDELLAAVASVLAPSGRESVAS